MTSSVVCATLNLRRKKPTGTEPLGAFRWGILVDVKKLQREPWLLNFLKFY